MGNSFLFDSLAESFSVHKIFNDFSFFFKNCMISYRKRTKCLRFDSFPVSDLRRKAAYFLYKSMCIITV